MPTCVTMRASSCPRRWRASRAWGSTSGSTSTCAVSMTEAAPRSGRLAQAIEGLPPGYFALARATGIASLAAHSLHLEPVAVALFWINVVAYGVLGLLMLTRLVRHRRKMAADMSDHARGPGFFTMPAGTCVLG